MKEKNDKLYYTWEDYDEDMAHLAFTTAELNQKSYADIVQQPKQADESFDAYYHLMRKRKFG